MRLIVVLAILWLAGCASAAKDAPALPTDSSAAPANPAEPVQPPEPKVRQYKAKNGNPAIEDDNQVFELERSSGCMIRWNVITYHARPKEYVIRVLDQCRFDLGLSRSLGAYGQLLDSVLAKYPKDRIKVFQSSSWRVIKAWDQDLAVAAIESGLWKDFLKRREDDPTLKSNKVFVQVFNEGNIARKLSEVFEMRGLTLRLKSVDDVLEKRFKNTAFASEYAAYSASNTKVPLNAGTYVFEVRLVGEN